MSLSSLYLDAFAEVARQGSFSKAARKLNVTQSALSQRVLNLEQELGSSLFIRDPSGVRLTELGQRLLRYCHSKSLLESELMETLKPQNADGLTGVVRVAGFSTVMRSVVLPLLAGFVKKNAQVSVELRSAELRDLPGMLFSGSADLILNTQPISKQGVENHAIGFEEYVLVQSSNRGGRTDVYLDQDEEDTFTYDFLKLQSRKPGPIKRDFVGDIYAIIDGVRLGMGRGVVPLHILKETKGLEPIKGHVSMKVPVYLSYYSQAFFTDLQRSVTQVILSEAAARLGGD